MTRQLPSRARWERLFHSPVLFRPVWVRRSRKRITDMLKDYSFEYMRRTPLVAREPIGGVGMITSWNWPINQIVLRVALALATGCAMVLKPSEIAPFSDLLLAEIMCPLNLLGLRMT